MFELLFVVAPRRGKEFSIFCVAARSIINSYVEISTEEKESEGR